MITYKPLDLEDKYWITNIVKSSNTFSSDYTFSVNFLWKEYLLLDLIDDKSFYSLFSNLYKAYLFPILDEMEENNYNKRLFEIINLLKLDAEKKQISFKLYGLTQESKFKLEYLFPNKFKYIVNRSLFDYIYKKQDLINLSGKKYHRKKSLVNYFKRNYRNWKYLPLTQSLFKDCLNLNLGWLSTKHEMSEMLDYEINIDKIIFQYFNELDLCGGAILLDNNLVGFTIGCEITDLVFEIIIEKAIVEYKGVYNILSQQFLNNLSGSYTYINKEEDLGLENLRKAKMLLYPDKLIEKYEAIWI